MTHKLMSLRFHTFRMLKYLLALLGFELRRIEKPIRRGLNLNVGCGSYEIDGFVSVDFFSDHYYGKDTNRFKNKVNYDMRNDPLPYDGNIVDNIYCSHVIEHIETEYVERFFEEAFRVLKVGGTLRVVCPDAEFLYRETLRGTEFFAWHPKYVQSEDAQKCFIDAVATHRNSLPNYGLEGELKEIPYDKLMGLLREGGVFNEAKPGQHINNWDFSRINSLGLRTGFKTILKSKVRGSSKSTLQGQDMDLTRPQMSLYVELTK